MDCTASRHPTAAQIKARRRIMKLSQTEAAKMLHTECRVWQQWESGARKMHPAFWELFRRKCAELFA